MATREIRMELTEQCVYDDGVLQSMYPGNVAEQHGYWAHLVPWYRPKNVLMLGYGAGTAAACIRRTWGDGVQILGVDTQVPPFKTQDTVVHEDAALALFTRDIRFFAEVLYDYIVIDLYDGDCLALCVTERAFVMHLHDIASDLVVVNVIGGWKGEDPYAKVFDLIVTKIVAGGVGNYIYCYRKHERSSTYGHDRH